MDEQLVESGLMFCKQLVSGSSDLVVSVDPGYDEFVRCKCQRGFQALDPAQGVTECLPFPRRIAVDADSSNFTDGTLKGDRLMKVLATSWVKNGQ